MIQAIPDGERERPEITVPHPRLLMAREVCAILQVHERTLRKWVKAEKFPPPIEMGGFVRWHIDVVSAWVDAKLEKVAEASRRIIAAAKAMTEAERKAGE